MKIKARFEFKVQDLWIGVFWRRQQTQRICDEDQGDNAIWRPRIAERLDVWLCLLPCIPFHIVALWGERLLSEEETMETMFTLDDE